MSVPIYAVMRPGSSLTYKRGKLDSASFVAYEIFLCSLDTIVFSQMIISDQMSELLTFIEYIWTSDIRRKS